MPSAIEEMLRYESPVQQGTFRIVAEPVEIRGKTLEAGSLVIALLGAANRDPELFPDPDRFDIARSPNRHLGFGIGIHFCMGASLARAEARIGFNRLLERLPGLQLAVTPIQADTPAKAPRPLLESLRRLIGRPVPTPPTPAEPAITWQSNAIVRSLKTLPVRW
jgi:cytochrome P450